MLWQNAQQYARWKSWLLLGLPGQGQRILDFSARGGVTSSSQGYSRYLERATYLVAFGTEHGAMSTPRTRPLHAPQGSILNPWCIYLLAPLPDKASAEAGVVTRSSRIQRSRLLNLPRSTYVLYLPRYQGPSRARHCAPVRLLQQGNMMLVVPETHTRGQLHSLYLLYLMYDRQPRQRRDISFPFLPRVSTDERLAGWLAGSENCRFAFSRTHAPSEEFGSRSEQSSAAQQRESRRTVGSEQEHLTSPS